MNDKPSTFGWSSANPEIHYEYVLSRILSLLPPKKQLNVIDVGCGNGFLVNQLSQLGHQIIGIDIAEDGIRIARETYPHLRFELFSAYSNFDSLLSVPFDVVIASEVIEHLFYPTKFLKNINSALQLEGYLILTTPYHGYLKNFALSLFNGWDKHHDSEREGGHIKFFSEKSLYRLLIKNGFDSVTFRNAGRFPFLWKSMVCRAKKHE